MKHSTHQTDRGGSFGSVDDFCVYGSIGAEISVVVLEVFVVVAAKTIIFRRQSQCPEMRIIRT